PLHHTGRRGGGHRPGGAQGEALQGRGGAEDRRRRLARIDGRAVTDRGRSEARPGTGSPAFFVADDVDSMARIGVAGAEALRSPGSEGRRLRVHRGFADSAPATRRWPGQRMTAIVTHTKMMRPMLNTAVIRV